MELQVASPSVIEALRTVAIVEASTVVVREVRTEIPHMAVARPMALPAADEVMVPDQRAKLTPAESVERKLSAMLRGGAAIPVSHYRLAKLCGKG